MNAERFMDMLNLLPDDMIISAVCRKHERKRKPVFLISTIAACFVAGVTAIVYPKLKVQPPEIREPDVTVTETLPVTSTTESETSITMPSALSVTSSAFTSFTIPAVSSMESTASVTTAPTVTTGISFTTAILTQTTSGTTAFTQTTKAAVQTAYTTPVLTQTVSQTETPPVVTAVTLTESSLQTTTAEVACTTFSEAGTTAQNEMTAIVTDITTAAHAAGRVQIPVRYWVLSRIPADHAADDPEMESTLYRESLPDDFSYETVPTISFSLYDCLILRFQTHGKENGCEVFVGNSSNYTLNIFAGDTAEEIVLAVRIPKTLFSVQSPNGLNGWNAHEISGIANSDLTCTLICDSEMEGLL